MIFTKILKQVFTYLRNLGHASVVYIDDSYLQAPTLEAARENVYITVHTLRNLGFIINTEKSILTPTQEIEFLGFIINSRDMTIYISAKRKIKILQNCSTLLITPTQTIRMVVAVVGTIVAALPGVKYGALFYRHLEICKNQGLQQHAGNFDKPITLSPEAINDIHWWYNNINTAQNNIRPPPVDRTFHADASLEGWGGTDGKKEVGGRWEEGESPAHINILELSSAKLVLTALAKDYSNCHID